LHQFQEQSEAMQRNPHSYQIATGYRTFYSLSLIYQPITKKRLFFIDKNLIDQPMSLEKRGLVLYEFCSMHYPAYKIMVTIAWIEAGMSLKKKPAEKVKTKRQMPPEYWEVIYGNYKESLRLCFLPIDDNTQNGYWFGFESEIQKAEPVFKAKEIMERCQNTQSPQINTDKSS